MAKPDKAITFGDWRPDIALRDNQFAAIAENVFPGANSYVPWPSLTPITAQQLPARCVGLTFARTATGSYVIFAGTAAKLYRWSGTAWVDVSRTAGGAYNVATGDRWSFAQFGTTLIAVQIGDVAQSINVDLGVNFDALAGSPPRAATVTVIGDFVLLSSLLSNRRMIQWSAVNDDTGWIVGTNLSDIQEFPDGGPVQGCAGSEIGFVVQDRTIRTMQFQPGNTDVIFSFSRVEREKGGLAKYGFLYTRGVLFFVAEDGFYGLGAQQPPIGANAVNDWFLLNSDPDRLEQVLAFADTRKPRVLFAYYSSSTSNDYDRMLCFDWSLNKWSYGRLTAQMWATLATPEVDLDTDIPGDALDIPLDSIRPSLDSYAYMGGRPTAAAIDVNGILCFLDGPPLEATMETGESHLSPTLRTFVSAAYPLVDAAGVTVAVGERENFQEPVAWGEPQAVGSTGSAPVYSSSRLHRFRVGVAAGRTWTHAQGVQVESQPDGEGY